MTSDIKDLSIDEQIFLALSLPSSDEALRTTYRRYYDGFQGAVLTPRQLEYLYSDESIPDSFGNIAALVVSLVGNRMQIRPQGEGIEGTGDSAKAIRNWWMKNGMDSKQRIIFENILVDSMCPVVIDWDLENGHPIWRPYRMWTEDGFDPSVRVFFGTGHDPYNPASMLPPVDMVAVRWKVVNYTDATGQGGIMGDFSRLNLMVRPSPLEPDSSVRIYRYWYQNDGSSVDLMTSEEIAAENGGISMPNPQIWPSPVIPVVMFHNHPIASEIPSIIRHQDMMNHNLSTLDISVDYHAFPMLTAEEFLDPDSTIGPAELLVGKNVRKIDPSDIGAMWKGNIYDHLKFLALIKSWPYWLLDPSSSGNAPSGEALRREEAPLIHQVKTKMLALNVSFDSLFRMSVDMHNTNVPSGVMTWDEDVKLQWVDPSTSDKVLDRRNESETAEKTQLSMQSTWMKVYGMSEEESKKELRLKTSEAMLTSGFETQDSNLNQGQNPDEANDNNNQQ